MLNSGDLTGDTFNVPIYVPYNDIQYLGGNANFNDIEINAGSLSSGQSLNLDQIGTNTSSLQYVFSGGFTMASGATLNVGANVNALIQSQPLTDSGTLTFATGDTVDFNGNERHADRRQRDHEHRRERLLRHQQRQLLHGNPGQRRRSPDGRQHLLRSQPNLSRQQQRLE